MHIVRSACKRNYAQIAAHIMHNLSMQTPIPDQVIAARKAAGHSQTAAGQTIDVSLRTWQYYESGREMPSGLYELYLLKTGQHPELLLVARGEASRAAAGALAVQG